MNKFQQSFLFVLFFAPFYFACTKGNNYSAGVNHSVGMTNSRIWSGNTFGYAIGDTVRGDKTFNWPEYFNRNISDTTFAVVNLNGFLIQIGNTVLNYGMTDSINQKVTFDSVIAGKLNATVIYYYSRDSITISFNAVSGYNDTALQYYQTNTFLYSHH